GQRLARTAAGSELYQLLSGERRRGDAGLRRSQRREGARGAGRLFPPPRYSADRCAGYRAGRRRHSLHHPARTCTMKLLKLSVLAATMVLASAALVMLMEIAAIFLGNTLQFSRFVGWVCGLAFLFIFAVNW